MSHLCDVCKRRVKSKFLPPQKPPTDGFLWWVCKECYEELK